MTSMLFYENATALNRGRHQNLKLQANPEQFLFAAKTNSVLLSGSEFGEALRDYPIVFIGAEGGPFAAAVLVGLAEKENLMVGPDGAWENNTYIPAFIRRYPFILASDEGSDTMTVCLDEACKGFNTENGEALFGADGTETPYLKSVVEFMQIFHAEMLRTGEFCARLAALGLLTSNAINVQTTAGEQTLAGIWLVDQEKLNALDDTQMLALARGGELTLIYAHLLSLSNITRMAGRLDARRRTDAAPAA
jgi:hypothetical protein